MAEIILGIGTSHGPMLVTPPETWGARVPFDRETNHHYKGKLWTFGELVKERSSEGLNEQISIDVWTRKKQACLDAITRLADIFDETRPDVAVIVGNDQMEVFSSDLVPAFAIFYGEKLINRPMSPEKIEKLPKGISISLGGYIPPETAVYDSVPDLGRHLIQSTVEDGFDIAAMARVPGDETPHAFGFIFRQIMRDRVIPTVPVFINTFYPPNQPPAKRCYEFGKSLCRAIESWDADVRVALFASGGLTHFVIDETIDQAFFDCLRTRRIDELTRFGETIYQDGTSEIKNWIPVAGAMADLDFEVEIIDYIPCYRSEAGTGNAMGFVCWRPK